MKYKLFLLVFAFVMLVPSMVFAQTSDVIEYDQKFSDVAVNDVDIIYLYDRGILQGHPDNTIKSNDPLLRAEVVTIFARYFDFEPVFDPNCSFSDVDPGVWYAGYVSALCNEGLIQGYPDGTFQAANNLTRAEAFAILVRGLGVENSIVVSNVQSDVDPNEWYAPYAQFAKDHNLFDGSQIAFDAGNLYTRKDIFENMYRQTRLDELGETYYTSALDPTIISNITNKSSNVIFNVSQGLSDYSSIFNAMKRQGIDTSQMDLYNDSYKNVAYRISQFYFNSPIKWEVSYDFFKTMDALGRIGFGDYPFNDEEMVIRNFYQEFGLSLGTTDINDTVNNSDIDDVVDTIINAENTYNTLIGDVPMSFITESDNKIVLRFNNYCSGNYYWFEGPDPDPTLINTFEAGIADFEGAFADNVTVMDSSNRELAVDRIWFGCDWVRRIGDDGKEVTTNMLGHYTIELGENLVDNETYTLEVEPTLLKKVINTNLNGISKVWGSGLADRDSVLPATTIDFERNSALEYVYQGEEDDSIVGVGIMGDVLYSWSGAEIYAVPYDAQSLPKDFAYDEMQWTILSGDASVEDAGGYNRIQFNSVGEVNLMVEYRGFTDTKRIYYNAGQYV
jgi:hypothetical protein